MNDRPTAGELLGVVRHFIESTVMPALEGPARYHARVAAHLLGVVAREIELEEGQLRGEWARLGELLGLPAATPPAEREALRREVLERNRELVERIRAGDADTGAWREAVLAHLGRVVEDKLAVWRPSRSHAGKQGGGGKG